MNDIIGNITRKLNESIDNPKPTTRKLKENDENHSSEKHAPASLHHCEECDAYYDVMEECDSSVCPSCGGNGVPYGKIVEYDVIEDEPTANTITEEEEDELRSEGNVIATEALKLLDHSNFSRFNEAYAPRTRMTSNGKLEVIMESSNGSPIIVSRKMTSRQKATYQLSEKYSSKSSVNESIKTKKNESIKAHRLALMMKNESRSIKVECRRVLERMGVRFDSAKFDSMIEKFIAQRNTTKMVESIQSNNMIGRSKFESMTPTEIQESITAIMEDTGLDVVSSEVDIDGETATANVRVEDSPSLEVHMSEVTDILSEVFDAPVEVVGPAPVSDNSTLSDLSIIVNSEDDINEDDEEDNEGPKNEAYHSNAGRKQLYALVLRESVDDDPEFLTNEDTTVLGSERGSEEKARLFSSEKAASEYAENEGIEDEYDAVPVEFTNEDDDDDMDDLKGIAESRRSRRNESHRRSRRRKNEAFSLGNGNTPLFALMSVDSTESSPEFLCHDDSLVSGTEDGSEDKARIFTSEEAANTYLTDAGLENKFEPKSITIVTNESDEDGLTSEDKITERIRRRRNRK